jgi:hypothetical protein
MGSRPAWQRSETLCPKKESISIYLYLFIYGTGARTRGLAQARQSLVYLSYAHHIDMEMTLDCPCGPVVITKVLKVKKKQKSQGQKGGDMR